ncbi:unnamed protein product [Tuber aestivum]|uniref:Ubiquitin-conjugating enzyme E2-binding protein n=1 Tax=Tuber aestivum TaxID=59557 RepID=A0A292PPN0_9PEZI|nr:unnamed protein product [Tuber aestivum]
MTTTPRFYAELLENIQSITISIHLPSPSNSTTRLDLDSPCLINLHHDGRSTPLTLPGDVTPTAGLALRACKPGEQTLCYRLPVSPSKPPSTATENYVPWAAIELNKEAATLFNCRVCGAQVIPENRIKTWKDLPSGNWEEMMDFWHCHRPDESHSHRHVGKPRYAPLQRGYVAESGTALVDLTYFLLAEADCSEAVEVAEVSCFTFPADRKKVTGPWKRVQWLSVSIQISKIDHPAQDHLELRQCGKYPCFSEQWVFLHYGRNMSCTGRIVMFHIFPTSEIQDPHVLHCKSCKSTLGIVDKKSSGGDSSGASRGWTLYKWTLCDGKSKTYPIRCFLAAQLVDLAENNGTRRIIFAAQEVKLRVWVFSTNTRYISSDIGRVMRAVKVFWQVGAGDKGGVMSAEGFEEIAIQKLLLEELKETIERGDQKFGEWNVGMVERFER